VESIDGGAREGGYEAIRRHVRRLEGGHLDGQPIAAVYDLEALAEHYGEA
jgi:hypothetical protein